MSREGQDALGDNSLYKARGKHPRLSGPASLAAAQLCCQSAQTAVDSGTQAARPRPRHTLCTKAAFGLRVVVC